MRRREFIAATLSASLSQGQSATQFQLACMTLPYSAFTFDRALQGIKGAGYRNVAWGTAHLGKPVLAVDAPPAESAKLAARCRGMGLEPLMMFSTVNIEAGNSIDLHARRIEQAAAARIPFLLTFGKTKAGEYEIFLKNLKAIASVAEAAKLTVVIKQHGGNTGTGEDCARIVREIGSDALKVCYDAGNVLDYEQKDPIADIRTCWRDVRAFCIKDHRLTPKNEDCGPGFGEIDHYKLFAPLMRTGLTMPLAFENIFEPLNPRPVDPAAVDELAKRARVYIEAVLRGLQRNHE